MSNPITQILVASAATVLEALEPGIAPEIQEAEAVYMEEQAGIDFSPNGSGPLAYTGLELARVHARCKSKVDGQNYGGNFVTIWVPDPLAPPPAAP